MRELTIRELQKAANARLITPGEAERVLERTVSHVTQRGAAGQPVCADEGRKT